MLVGRGNAASLPRGAEFIGAVRVKYGKRCCPKGRGSPGLMGLPLLAGVPLVGVTLAGSFHGRVCTPGRLQRRGACSAKPRLRPRRATFFFASPKKKARKATRPPRSFAARMTPLRCSAGRNGLSGGTEPLRTSSRALAVDHLHFLSPLARRLEGSAGGKRAAHV